MRNSKQKKFFPQLSDLAEISEIITELSKGLSSYKAIKQSEFLKNIYDQLVELIDGLENFGVYQSYKLLSAVEERIFNGLKNGEPFIDDNTILKMQMLFDLANQQFCLMSGMIENKMLSKDLVNSLRESSEALREGQAITLTSPFGAGFSAKQVGHDNKEKLIAIKNKLLNRMDIFVEKERDTSYLDSMSNDLFSIIKFKNEFQNIEQGDNAFGCAVNQFTEMFDDLFLVNIENEIIKVIDQIAAFAHASERDIAIEYKFDSPMYPLAKVKSIKKYLKLFLRTLMLNEFYRSDEIQSLGMEVQQSLRINVYSVKKSLYIEMETKGLGVDLFDPSNIHDSECLDLINSIEKNMMIDRQVDFYKNRGSNYTIVVPYNSSMMYSYLMEVKEKKFFLPEDHIQKFFNVSKEMFSKSSNGAIYCEVDGESIPVIGEIFGKSLSDDFSELENFAGVVVNNRAFDSAVLLVDSVSGRELVANTQGEEMQGEEIRTLGVVSYNGKEIEIYDLSRIHVGERLVLTKSA